MAQSIKLNDNLYWDASSLYMPVVKADWTATSSSASLTNVTDTATLSKGTWLAICRVPIASVDTVNYTLRAPSGTTDLGTNTYSLGGTYSVFITVFVVSSSTATVVLRTASSTAVTYSYTERGGCTFIKLSS